MNQISIVRLFIALLQRLLSGMRKLTRRMTERVLGCCKGAGGRKRGRGEGQTKKKGVLSTAINHYKLVLPANLFL